MTDLMQYKNRFGSIEILGNKSFNKKTIGISMSGGADSTMLCYLIANTIHQKNLNIKIQPYNGYDLWCSSDSAGLPEIIKYLQNKFPSVTIHWPIATIFDTKGSLEKGTDKNSYIRPLIDNLVAKGIIDQVMHAVCLGPPVSVQETFEGWGIFRQPGHRLWEEIEKPANIAPFVTIDKRFIMQCYKDFGIEKLLRMTNSCTAPQGNCSECWWCQERAWAILEVNK
jgi:hypothetical protein